MKFKIKRLALFALLLWFLPDASSHASDYQPDDYGFMALVFLLAWLFALTASTLFVQKQALLQACAFGFLAFLCLYFLHFLLAHPGYLTLH